MPHQPDAKDDSAAAATAATRAPHLTPPLPVHYCSPAPAAALLRCVSFTTLHQQLSMPIFAAHTDSALLRTLTAPCFVNINSALCTLTLPAHPNSALRDPKHCLLRT